LIEKYGQLRALARQYMPEGGTATDASMAIRAALREAGHDVLVTRNPMDGRTIFPVSCEDTDAPHKDVECMICKTMKRIIVAFPCNHLTMCGGCCLQSRQIPDDGFYIRESALHACILCRQDVEEFIKIYW
jgi:hypothetical protein